MSRLRMATHDRLLTPEENNTVYKMIEAAVDATDTSGKSTDQIYGEIFTRFRTDVAIYGAHESLKQLFCLRLKSLNGTQAGKILNDMINETYQKKAENDETFLDLEICTTVIEDCLLEAKQVSEQSEKVISNLKQIDKQLDGGSNV